MDRISYENIEFNSKIRVILKYTGVICATSKIIF